MGLRVQARLHAISRYAIDLFVGMRHAQAMQENQATSKPCSCVGCTYRGFLIRCHFFKSIVIIFRPSILVTSEIFRHFRSLPSRYEGFLTSRARTPYSISRLASPSVERPNHLLI